MRISAKCDYACKALLELALHWPNKRPLHISIISERQNIPMRYLVQILIQLKSMGFLQSSRGKHGGYTLIKPPGEISLGELIRNITGPLLPKASSVSKDSSIFTTIWGELEEAMGKMLDRITFEDICNKAKGMREAILYQI